MTPSRFGREVSEPVVGRAVMACGRNDLAADSTGAVAVVAAATVVVVAAVDGVVDVVVGAVVVALLILRCVTSTVPTETVPPTAFTLMVYLPEASPTGTVALICDVPERVKDTAVDPNVTPPVAGTPTKPVPLIVTVSPVDPLRAFVPVGADQVHLARYS